MAMALLALVIASPGRGYNAAVAAPLHAPLPSLGRRQRQRDRQRRSACLRLVAQSDFSVDRFVNGWMRSGNLSAYMECLYQLRTSLRSRDKAVHVGGLHYPTLIVANHMDPVVSTSGPRWCWLDSVGTWRNGLSHATCCDTQYGPRGLEACWNRHFTFELCCLGDLAFGEAPHFYSAPALDINVGNTVKMRGTFDLRMSYALQALCRRGDVVLDVGANIGGYTVPLAERVGPTGEVHAFEPFRKIFQHLNANVALNGLSNVYTYNAALGREEKAIEVYAPDLNTFNFPSAMRVEGQPEAGAAERNNVFYEPKRMQVTMSTLDRFDFGQKVDLIKIDVEFMELEVVLGARETIRRYSPVIWAENEPFFDKVPDRRFVDAMAAEFGYHCQVVSHLELLCTPPALTDAVTSNVNRIFKHINKPIHMLSLQDILTEVDPGFATVV